MKELKYMTPTDQKEMVVTLEKWSDGEITDDECIDRMVELVDKTLRDVKIELNEIHSSKIVRKDKGRVKYLTKLKKLLEETIEETKTKGRELLREARSKSGM